MSKPDYIDRTWLNKPGFHSTASVFATVETNRDGFEAKLSIADCTRKAELDFDYWCQSDGKSNKAELDNVAFKSRTLRASVNAFLDQVDALVAQERVRKAA